MFLHRVKMLKLFCVVVSISVVASMDLKQEVDNSTKTSEIELTVEDRKNAVKNGTFEIQSIIQPIQTQPFERALSQIENNNKSNIKIDDKLDFRPSPPLETYFEFNKFPVVPALPEAKHASFSSKGIFDNFPWSEKGGSQNAQKNEQPWVSHIKFPTAADVTIRKEHPYQFVTNEKSHSIVGTKTFGYPPIKNANFPVKNKNIYESKDHGHALTINSNIDKFEHNLGYNSNPVLHKTYFDYNLPEKAPTKEVSPWKKVVKLLATFIPIGLLISALTPSVITITPMNNSQSRSRADDSENLNSNRILTSLKYLHKLSTEGCEERILCELILGAGTSADSEKHIDNLLKTFTEEDSGFVESADDLKLIFDAVKKKKCSSLKCETIQTSTKTNDNN